MWGCKLTYNSTLKKLERNAEKLFYLGNLFTLINRICPEGFKTRYLQGGLIFEGGNARGALIRNATLFKRGIM